MGTPAEVIGAGTSFLSEGDFGMLAHPAREARLIAAVAESNCRRDTFLKLIVGHKLPLFINLLYLIKILKLNNSD